MQLVEFRVRNFRSVNDSGTIRVERRTALVGRNESGKSNLLMALRSLKPPEGLRALSKIKDFPKDRRMAEFSDDLPVVDTRWELTSDEQAELARRWPRAKAVRALRVSRPYAPRRTVVLEGLEPFSFDAARATRAVEGLESSRPLLPAERGNLGNELSKLVEAARGGDDAAAWAERTQQAVTAFRRYLRLSQTELPPAVSERLEELFGLANAVLTERSQSADAEAYLADRLPVFIYVHDYPELAGHIDLDALLSRIEEDKLRAGDDYFLKLMKVAGLDVAELARLLARNHELRQHLANRGGAVVTKAIRQLWTDRPLKVRFNLDANHFDILISDPNQPYDVEVNLDERSRGFRWFFSFYVTFCADTEGGPAENAVLLLDEPGIHLHAVAQRDLLTHFTRDFKNQVLYTTHSPFMIPTSPDQGVVRTVNIDSERGTWVENEATGDAATLIPLQAALDLARRGSLSIPA